MKSIILIKEFKTYRKVKYYTLQYEEHETSETMKFFEKMQLEPKFAQAVSELKRWIEKIGNDGAFPKLFRNEDAGEALPPPGKGIRIEGLGLDSPRLYCIRLNNNVVILGNGGIKTARWALNCPNCKPHLRFIHSIARQIYGADLTIDANGIRDFKSLFFEY